MKSKIKDKAINIIMEDSKRLKKLTKQYYASEEEQEDELLKSMSRTRGDITAKLDILLDLNIINIDEWIIIYRMIMD